MNRRIVSLLLLLSMLFCVSCTVTEEGTTIIDDYVLLESVSSLPEAHPNATYPYNRYGFNDNEFVYTTLDIVNGDYVRYLNVIDVAEQKLLFRVKTPGSLWVMMPQISERFIVWKTGYQSTADLLVYDRENKTLQTIDTNRCGIMPFSCILKGTNYYFNDDNTADSLHRFGNDEYLCN